MKGNTGAAGRSGTGLPAAKAERSTVAPQAHDHQPVDRRGRDLVRPEWIRAEAVINAGLIVVGIYIVQSLLAANFTDVVSRIAVIAWAVAIPLLAVLGMLNVAQEGYRFAAYPFYLIVARAIAQACSLAGLVAAFWHIWMLAGIVLVVSGLAALGLYATHSRRLERDNPETR